MKKATLFISAIALSLLSFGQVKQMNNGIKPQLKKQSNLKFDSNQKFKASLNGNRASNWLNYALQLDDPNGFTPGAAKLNFMNIFPDTSIILGQYTSGATAYPQFMRAATMLDPKNMPVNGITASDPYTLDSIGIVYAYLRATASTVTDTLEVQIFKHDAALEWDLSSGTATYQDIEYDFATNQPKPAQILATYTYLLTEADSSNYPSELFFSTSNIPQQAAGNRIGAIAYFKPGYSYSITDSLNDKNGFYVCSYEQNGDGGGTGTDPVFYGTYQNGASDLNCSYNLPASVRFNINANGWNGYFIPTWAWTTPYAYEHHLIEFLISTANGVEDFVNGVKFGQNVPNPFNGTTTINYELEKAANATLNVYDVTGKLVAEVKEGNQTAGKHTINFNAETMSAGVYYYSLKVNNDISASKKMVVIK